MDLKERGLQRKREREREKCRRRPNGIKRGGSEGEIDRERGKR